MGDYHVDQKNMTIQTKTQQEEFDVFVVFYGWEANVPDVFNEFSLARNHKGFIETNVFRQTSSRGVWAIGEVTQQVHPCVVTAMSDGVICAKAIEQL